jgi:hypothetical protein
MARLISSDTNMNLPSWKQSSSKSSRVNSSLAIGNAAPANSPAAGSKGNISAAFENS